MHFARRFLAPLVTSVLLGSTLAHADGPVCAPVSKIPLERHLRQLSLDLLGRPPTMEEYAAAQARGEVSVEDVRAMMDSEEFYQRIRGYHRALLWSNVNSSVNNNANSRTSNAGGVNDPIALMGNTSNGLRGANGQMCDPDIAQATCNDSWQDPQTEELDAVTKQPKTPKVCADERGVPLPVSWDYDTNSFYRCERLDQTPNDATITSCQVAVDKGRLAAKYLNFCDMRRVSNKLVPHLCKPDPTKTNTAVLTGEEVDTPSGRVMAFVHPSPPAGTTLTRLDRCTLKMTERNGIKGTYVAQRGCVMREGYAMAPPPFWSTSAAQVKVCAIEAQTRPSNPWTLESCTTARFTGDRSCGCGESMRRCEAPGGTTHSARVSAINVEPELIADAVVRRDEPYFNILTTRRSFVNGPLSEMYRDRQQAVGVLAVTPPAASETVPVLGFAEATTWREYLRGSEHSGVLTTPAFLYRFPTQRARVNHFYSAFLCKAFVPAEGRPPAAEDACNRENNLAKRCGCSNCHATIEPTGAHWGRFAERGATYLEPSRFPRFDPKCRDCALAGNVSCGGECGQYVMQAYDGDGANSLGLLSTYLYRTADEEQNIEAGPQLLVERMLQTGALERCTVQRVWQEFLGRPMSTEEKRMYLDPFAQEFAADGYRLKGLIERLLMSDAYRRID